MEEPKAINPLRRLAADAGTGRHLPRRVYSDSPAMEEDASPEVAREDIVRDMMRIFDGLMGCTSKRGGNSLAFLDRKNKLAVVPQRKPENGIQRKLEKQIYVRIKGLVEQDSPNTGFALNVLYNNAMYYYDKANVPLSFGTFLTSLVTFMEGHDCLNICPDEMGKMKTLLARG